MRNLEGTGIPFVVYSALALIPLWFISMSIEERFEAEWNRAITEMYSCVKRSDNETCYRMLWR